MADFRLSKKSLLTEWLFFAKYGIIDANQDKGIKKC